MTEERDGGLDRPARRSKNASNRSSRATRSARRKKSAGPEFGGKHKRRNKHWSW